MREKTSDEAAIRMAVLDYAEGWFEGDPNRMARCLHPELAKRGVERDPASGKIVILHASKQDMIRYTQDGGGTQVPRERLFYKIDLLECNQEIAIVRVETYPYVDHVQLVNMDGQWQILNVLYTVKPTPGS